MYKIITSEEKEWGSSCKKYQSINDTKLYNSWTTYFTNYCKIVYNYV